jgi:hypothetical protein
MHASASWLQRDISCWNVWLVTHASVADQFSPSAGCSVAFAARAESHPSDTPLLSPSTQSTLLQEFTSCFGEHWTLNTEANDCTYHLHVGAGTLDSQAVQLAVSRGHFLPAARQCRLDPLVELLQQTLPQTTAHSCDFPAFCSTQQVIKTLPLTLLKFYLQQLSQTMLPPMSSTASGCSYLLILQPHEPTLTMSSFRQRKKATKLRPSFTLNICSFCTILSNSGTKHLNASLWQSACNRLWRKFHSRFILDTCKHCHLYSTLLTSHKPTTRDDTASVLLEIYNNWFRVISLHYSNCRGFITFN